MCAIDCILEVGDINTTATVYAVEARRKSLRPSPAVLFRLRFAFLFSKDSHADILLYPWYRPAALESLFKRPAQDQYPKDPCVERV
jgi:hypothetical protein